MDKAIKNNTKYRQGYQKLYQNMDKAIKSYTKYG